MSAVPQLGPSRAPRRRRRHGGALLAALAYALAGFALYQLVAPSLRDEPAARPEPATAATPPAQVDLPGVGPREELALRAVASRVQQSVYRVGGNGAAGGSAFAAWVHQGKISFFLTARAAVGGASGHIGLRNGHRSLKARVIRSDPRTGLAVLRVNAPVERPLWPSGADRAPLRDGGAAIAVPAGRTGSFGQGKLAKAAHAFSLPHVGAPEFLGAPVLDEDGELAGVVVELTPGGRGRLVSLADACRRVRACV